jgi:hypothetical protein
VKILVFFFLLVFVAVRPAGAETLEEQMKKIEESIQKQQELLKDQQKALEDLRDQAKQGGRPAEGKETSSSPSRDYRLDDRSRGIYLKSASPITPYSLTQQTTPSLMNPAISVILDTFYYNSNLSKEELESREIPGYARAEEPFTKGFNLRSAELAIFAPVDPYFNFYATIPIEEEGVELEEAYFVTTFLPAGFQVKGGKFKSGFGRFNAFHPHAWDFVDAPLVYKSFLGGEGLIEKGVQLTYLPPLPFYLVLGAEVLQGENSVLYGPDAHSGAHAYSGFAKSSFDFAGDHTILLGASITGGKTLTDSFAADTEFKGDSVLYGAELTYKWKPSKRTSFVLQSEYLYRTQDGDLADSAAGTVDSLKRKQDGVYLQALYQFERWRVGARYDRLDIFKDEVIRAGEKVNYSGQPYRATGSLEFNPTEFSRIRLQYNYDKSARAEKENHEVFLQVILGVGAHGAHPF